jgi:iron complex transport system ATP-binding protein
MVKLIIDNISVNYNSIQALKDINIKLEKGTMVSIIGPNGSGKTTLLRSIAKIVKPIKGTIYIDNKNLNNIPLKELAHHVSYTSPTFKEGFDLTVGDIVFMGRYPKTGFIMKHTDEEIVNKALNTFHIKHLINRKIEELSDGERQKALLARSLAQEAEIILVDEPLAHLDLKAQLEVLKILKNEANNGKLVIITSHTIDLPAKYSDIIIVMKKGQILAIGKPNEILTEQIIENTYNIKCKIIKNYEYPIVMLLDTISD